MATAELAYPKVGNDPVYASELNRFNNSIWTKVKGGNTTTGGGLIKFSDTIWQTTSKISSDAGVTWSVGGYGAVADEDIAATSGANGIAVDASDGSVSFTSNSGTTWAAASTGLSNYSSGGTPAIFGSAAVIGGVFASGIEVWYSTDGGDNWQVSASGPTENVYAIVMASATVGYMVDDNENIWKTTDGGANWTDTTDQSPVTGPNVTMFTTDTDTCYILDGDIPHLSKYINSTNTSTTIMQKSGSASANEGRTTNIIQATNGDICFGFWPTSTGGDSVNLLLFAYDGTDIKQKVIGIGWDTTNAAWVAGTATINVLIEVDDILYVQTGNYILEVPL